jgi:hypothetical protein
MCQQCARLEQRLEEQRQAQQLAEDYIEKLLKQIDVLENFIGMETVVGLEIQHEDSDD